MLCTPHQTQLALCSVLLTRRSSPYALYSSPDAARLMLCTPHQTQLALCSILLTRPQLKQVIKLRRMRVAGLGGAGEEHTRL